MDALIPEIIRLRADFMIQIQPYWIFLLIALYGLFRVLKLYFKK